MPDYQTIRHALPFIAVAQALKEVTHNEALVRIDALLHPVVESQLSLPPAVGLADAGKCWLVAPNASGDWQGQAENIAVWTGDSWWFQLASAGMRIRNRQNGTDIIWTGTMWVIAPTIDDPESGTVIDVEARVAIASLLSYFRTIGQFTS